MPSVPGAEWEGKCTSTIEHAFFSSWVTYNPGRKKERGKSATRPFIGPDAKNENTSRRPRPLRGGGRRTPEKKKKEGTIIEFETKGIGGADAKYRRARSVAAEKKRRSAPNCQSTTKKTARSKKRSRPGDNRRNAARRIGGESVRVPGGKKKKKRELEFFGVWGRRNRRSGDFRPRRQLGLVRDGEEEKKSLFYQKKASELIPLAMIRGKGERTSRRRVSWGRKGSRGISARSIPISAGRGPRRKRINLGRVGFPA